MRTTDRPLVGGVRWARWGIGLLVMVPVLGWTLAGALAGDLPGPAGAMSLAPQIEVPEGQASDSAGPAEPDVMLPKDLTLTLDPKVLADAAAPAPATGGGEEAAKAAPAPGVHCPPPLPLYNVEGQGGTLLVPMAYLINCEAPGTKVGMPTAGYTFVRAGTKTVQEVHVSETFYRRIEINYTLGTLNLGDFPRDVRRATGVDIGFEHVVLHNFNLRGIVIEEGKCNPAVTAGVTFKYNPNVQEIDRRLGGGVRALGMARSNSADYTLTATKTVIEPCFKRPLMLTGGIRFSEAAQLGYLGFGDTYRMTGEGSVVYLITDWLGVAYEYRQKKNPYDTLGTLVGKEGAWQAVDVAFIVNEHLTFAVGWLCAGNVANGRADNGWGFQLKYEF
jgi:hypothetical protein